jgi:hypothetical protein
MTVLPFPDRRQRRPSKPPPPPDRAERRGRIFCADAQITARLSAGQYDPALEMLSHVLLDAIWRGHAVWHADGSWEPTTTRRRRLARAHAASAPWTGEMPEPIGAA